MGPAQIDRPDHGTCLRCVPAHAEFGNRPPLAIVKSESPKPARDSAANPALDGSCCGAADPDPTRGEHGPGPCGKGEFPNIESPLVALGDVDALADEITRGATGCTRNGDVLGDDEGTRERGPRRAS